MKKLGLRWVNAIERSDDIRTWVSFVSEIASGSRQKYALDKQSGQLVLHRAMANGIHYPTNYGFVPRTLSESDEMEIDLMAISTEPLLPLTIARVRLIGGCTIKSAESELPEDKLLGVVLRDPGVESLASIDDVDPALRSGIEKFFTTYKQDQGVEVTFERWFHRTVAIQKLEAGLRAAKRARRKQS